MLNKKTSQVVHEDLDKKLQAIQAEIGCCHYHNESKEFRDKIKQAFKDAGYVQLPEPFDISNENDVLGHKLLTIDNIKQWLNARKEAVLTKNDGYCGPDFVLPLPTPRTSEELQAIQEELNKPRMTGQEWYEQFVECLPLSTQEVDHLGLPMKGEPIYTRAAVSSAAKKAAGIK